MANEYGPGMKLPTAQQLAEKLGVTLTTLDRSLAKLEAKGTISRRQGSGIYVSNNLLDLRIGMVFGRNIFQLGGSAFYLLMLQHCEKLAEAEQKQFSFFLSPNHRAIPHDTGQFNPELAASLKQDKLDGLLLCEINNDEYEKWIASKGIPTVALAPSKHFPTVGIDSEQLIRDSVAHLASQGCQTIGLMGILSRHYEFFEKAAAQHNLTIQHEAVIHPEDEKDPPFDTHEPLGREWMRLCLERCGGKEGLPDGIVMTDDLLARGACRHLKDQNIQPGKDLKIVSHANKGSLSLEYWQDHITLAEVDPDHMVHKMFELLEDQIAGRKLSSKAHKIAVSIQPPEI